MTDNRYPFHSAGDDVSGLLSILRAGLERYTGQDSTILAIGRLADMEARDAVPLLRRACEHAAPAVRTSAAMALYQLGFRVDAVRALKRALDDEYSFVAAARVLADIGTDETIAALQAVRWRPREYLFDGTRQPAGAIVASLLGETNGAGRPRNSSVVPKAPMARRMDTRSAPRWIILPILVLLAVSLLTVSALENNSQPVYDTHADRNPLPSSGRTLVIRAQSADVRAAPTNTGEVLAVLSAGRRVREIRTVGEWHQVTVTVGNTVRRGWIHESTVTVATR